MRNFAEGEGLMTNARCLTEGVDLPAIDCVVFTDPKRSKVDIVQAAGRALRLSKGKKFGYILIPIFIPDGADFNEAAEEQGFDDVAVTVRALATTDTRITEYLRVIAEGKKPRGGSPVDGITSVNSLYKIEAEEFDKAIKLKVWNKVAVVNFRKYEDAKKYVQQKKIYYSKDFRKLKIQNKIPKDIPYNPNQVYIDKWVDWGNFLGTGRVHNKNKKFISYKEAKKLVRSHNIKISADYYSFYKTYENKHLIPAIPNRSYKNKGWKNWIDFLGTNRGVSSEYLNYTDARKIAKKLKCKSLSEYIIIGKKNKLPYGLPKYPGKRVYGKDWVSLGDFLGTGRIADQYKKDIFVKFNEAKKTIKKFKLNRYVDFLNLIQFKKKPNTIPSSPQTYYKKEWKGWPDFLGKKK